MCKSRRLCPASLQPGMVQTTETLFQGLLSMVCQPSFMVLSPQKADGVNCDLCLSKVQGGGVGAGAGEKLTLPKESTILD